MITTSVKRDRAQRNRNGLCGSGGPARHCSFEPLRGERLMKVMVTGGAGYIGSITAEVLLAHKP